MKFFMTKKELVVRAMMEDLELGIKRPSTLTLMYKVLMVTGEVDIRIKLDPLPPIIHVSLLYCLVFLFMETREV